LRTYLRTWNTARKEIDWELDVCPDGETPFRAHADWIPLVLGIALSTLHS